MTLIITAIPLSTLLTNFIIIDLFFIKLLIKILAYLMFIYCGFFTLVIVSMHIGANNKFILKGLKLEIWTIQKFHIVFIFIFYSLLFVFNHIIFFVPINIYYIYIIVIIINYLFLNIIFHAYITGVDTSYNYLGVVGYDCLFFGDISCLILRLLVFCRVLDEWNNFILYWEKFIKIITMPFYYAISLFFKNNSDVPFLIKNFRFNLWYFMLFLILLVFSLVLIIIIYKFYKIKTVSKTIISRSKNKYIIKRWQFNYPPVKKRYVLIQPNIAFIKYNQPFHYGHYVIYNTKDEYAYILTSRFNYRFYTAAEFWGKSLLKKPLYRLFTIRCVPICNINTSQLKKNKIPLHGSSLILTKLILNEFFKKWDLDWKYQTKTK